MRNEMNNFREIILPPGRLFETAPLFISAIRRSRSFLSPGFSAIVAFRDRCI